MTQDERDRLTRLEVQQGQILDEVRKLNKSVEAMKLNNAKLGGIGFALTAVAAFVTWLLTRAKDLLQIFGT